MTCRWLALTCFTLSACALGSGRGGAAAARDDEEGQRELLAGHPKEAYAAFRKAVATTPSDVAAYRHEVEAARAVGKLEELTDAARKALAKAPADAWSHYRLGLCLFAHTDGERDGLAELAEAARRAPTEFEFQLRLGAALLEAERPQEALAPLAEAVKLHPSDPHPRLPYALALHRAGRDPEAVLQIGAALPLQPDSADLKALHHLMDRLTDRARVVPAAVRPRFEDALSALDMADAPARAADLLEALVAEQPLLPAIHTALGLAYLRLGDNAQAVSHLRRAIEIDPSAAEPYLYLAEIFHGLRRDSDARDQLRLAVARDPMLESAHDQLLQIALQSGDAAEAITEGRALLGLRAGDPATRLILAQALEQLGEFAAAEDELRAVAAEPAKRNDHDRAADDGPSEPFGKEAELALEGTRLQARLELGNVELIEGQKARDPNERGRHFDEARSWLAAVLKAQPDNIAAQRLLAQVPR